MTRSQLTPHDGANCAQVLRSAASVHLTTLSAAPKCSAAAPSVLVLAPLCRAKAGPCPCGVPGDPKGPQSLTIAITAEISTKTMIATWTATQKGEIGCRCMRTTECISGSLL
jgi:hypothetical protein